MGTTATSLHLLSLAANPAALGGEIEKAYRKLCYANPKKPKADDFVGGRMSLVRRLRFVAPKLCLDESLMREVDHAALEEVAAVRQRRRATEIELLPGRNLAELETALAPLRRHSPGLDNALVVLT